MNITAKRCFYFIMLRFVHSFIKHFLDMCVMCQALHVRTIMINSRDWHFGGGDRQQVSNSIDQLDCSRSRGKLSSSCHWLGRKSSQRRNLHRSETCRKMKIQASGKRTSGGSHLQKGATSTRQTDTLLSSQLSGQWLLNVSWIGSCFSVNSGSFS